MPNPSNGALAKEISYVGIDPGQSGGIAGVGPRGIEIASNPMPATEADVWRQIKSIAHHFDAYAVIERVHSMPGQGVSSSFKFGKGYGGLRMALTAAGIPFEEVDPRKWQKALGVVPRGKTESKTEFKNRLKAMAQRLHPKADVTLKTADALLLATYCQRLREGRL